MICLEHKLSVITPKPYRERTKYSIPERLSIRDQIRADIDAAMRHKPQSFQELAGLLEQAGYEYQEGKHPAIRGKNQKKFVRFKSLGDGYTPEDLGLVFAGEREHQPRKPDKRTGADCPEDEPADRHSAKAGGWKKHRLCPLGKSVQT